MCRSSGLIIEIVEEVKIGRFLKDSRFVTVKMKKTLIVTLVVILSISGSSQGRMLDALFPYNPVECRENDIYCVL